MGKATQELDDWLRLAAFLNENGWNMARLSKAMTKLRDVIEAKERAAKRRPKVKRRAAS